MSPEEIESLFASIPKMGAKHKEFSMKIVKACENYLTTIGMMKNLESDNKFMLDSLKVDQMRNKYALAGCLGVSVEDLNFALSFSKNYTAFLGLHSGHANNEILRKSMSRSVAGDLVTTLDITISF